MPRPPTAPLSAATLGSSTDHEGTVIVGLPTVLVNGAPAARLTDLTTCPESTGTVPHIGGPIVAPGAGTVYVGNLPAARVTDLVVEVGPESTITTGSPNVFIGR